MVRVVGNDRQKVALYRRARLVQRDLMSRLGLFLAKKIFKKRKKEKRQTRDLSLK